MEISKLKTLTTPNLNDLLPILDINGGVSGKPILRKATLSSLLALAESGNSSGFEIPTLVKTVADNGDYFIGIDSTGTPYKITKANLLAGLSSGGSGSGSGTPQPSSTILLLHGDSSPIVDSSSYALIPVSNSGVTISVMLSKFSGSSLLFNGGILSYNSSNFNVGSGNCTVEFFLYTSNTSSGQNVVDFRPLSTQGNYPTIYLLNNKISYAFGNITVDGNVSPLVNDWNYVALRKIGTTTELWLNGSNVGSGVTGNWGDSNGIILGTGAFGLPFYGYIDEFRFSKVSQDVSIIPSLPFS
ncbi:LamG-like jellyroll fold domain-containing protein [Nostoc sp. NMS9]|uniref:LamG-like jellyroll fold domain-containing protein n=1 Tax=Nostoc sp. NMS9 TaxID=2815393 RepID=UPI0025D4CCAB|nr:LamG-like jellyroll fold domain-containing protein [Nostoc sp. NMS9]MBN3944121.1 hypothetical protein [Nostoc sp. NMS9]